MTIVKETPKVVKSIKFAYASDHKNGGVGPARLTLWASGFSYRRAEVLLVHTTPLIYGGLDPPG